MDPRDRRDQAISTRISTSERVLLEAFCQAEGITPSEAVRRFLLGCLSDHRGREGILASAYEWCALLPESRKERLLSHPRAYHKRALDACETED